MAGCASASSWPSAFSRAWANKRPRTQPERAGSVSDGTLAATVALASGSHAQPRCVSESGASGRVDPRGVKPGGSLVFPHTPQLGDIDDLAAVKDEHVGLAVVQDRLALDLIVLAARDAVLAP